MEKKKKESEKRLKRNRAQKETQENKDPNQKEYSVPANMAYIMKGTFGFQKPLIGFMLFYVITSVAGAYLPTFALSAVMACVTDGAGTEALLRTVLVFFVVWVISDGIRTFCNANVWWRLIDARIQFMMLRIRKVLYMDYEYIESAKVMEVCQKAMRATGGNTNGVEGMMRAFLKMLEVLASSMTAILIVSRLSPWIVVMLLGLGVLIYFNMDYAKKRDKKTWDELAPYWRKTWYMQQTMTNFVFGKDIRLFSMKRWLLGKYAGLHRFIHKRMKESKNRWFTCAVRNSLLILVQEAAVYAYLIWRVLKTGLPLADFMLYFGAVTTFFGVMFDVFNNLTDLKMSSREVNDFRTFLDYPERGKQEDSRKQEGPAAKGETLPRLSGQKRYEFIFENVSFRYPESERYALKNLNLTLTPGERLAVVGLNGAGKSTFIKLLCGLYMPTEGRILLNGTDIRLFDKREYYELFAPVFQNVELFAFPMDENVSMRVAQETDTALAEQYLREAGLGEKIDSLPKGVKTDLLKIISEDGVELSGGESQKLALARALYKNAPIVVLDEPTSALDALAEYRMYQNFDRMIGGKTAVYISHRLSSTRFCDHVAMFADGELKEYGTHESLLAAGGAYREMFDVQSQYYREEGADCEQN